MPPDRTPPAHRRRVPRLLQRSLLLLGALLLPLLLAELLLRAACPRDWFFTAGRLDEFQGAAGFSRGILAADLELGHVPVLDGRLYDRCGIMRDDACKGRPDGRRVLFVGDSVTRRARLVRAIAAQCPGIVCLNAGVEAWSPLQEVEFYFRVNQKAAPQQVVLTLHNNDFSVTPVGLDTEAGFTVCMPGVLAPFDPGLYRVSYLYRLWVNARNRGLAGQGGYLRNTAAVEAALRRLRDGLQRDGVALAVLLLPILAPLREWEPEEVGSRDAAIAICRRLQLPWIDLLPPLEQVLAAGGVVREQPLDGWHPNDLAATAMVAGALAQDLVPDRGATASADRWLVSAGKGEAQRLQIDLGPAFAGRAYRVIGSRSGCCPGVAPGGVPVWLNPDELALATFAQPDATMTGGVGTLDADGRAVVRIRGPRPAGGEALLVHHVALVLTPGLDRIAVATNPVPLVVGR